MTPPSIKDELFLEFNDPFNLHREKSKEGLKEEDFLNSGPEAVRHWYEEDGKNIFYNNGKLKTILVSAYLRTIHHIKTMRDRNGHGEIFLYDINQERYRADGESLLKEETTKILEEMGKSRYVQEVIFDIKMKSAINRNDFKLDPKYIPVKNGILEIIKTKQDFDIIFINNDPKFYVVNRIPVDYKPEDMCLNVNLFLDQILSGNQTAKTWIQEYIGYMLYRTFPFDYVMMLLGDGYNGKSTFINYVQIFLGEENITSISVYDLCHGSWYVAELYNKMANLDADIEAKDLTNTGKFKRVTGGDRVMGERKHQHPFYFNSYCKHLWSCNTIPYCYDDSDAFHRRWIIIQFFEQFKGNDKRTDPNILDKLTPELSGFLNWTLKGLLRILNNNKFTDISPIENRRNLWKRLSDPLYTFLQSSWVAYDTEGYYPKEDFIKDLHEYCIMARLPLWTKDRVSKTITKYYEKITSSYPSIEGRQKYSWKGIKPAEKKGLV